MSNPQNRALRMGSAPVPRLLLEFSLPVMTGMLVQALYSVINRFFIGNAPEAATLGMAAITVGMPLIFLMMAFGMLVGMGGSASLSIFLGQKDQGKAEQVLGNSLTLTVTVGLAMTVLGLVFLDPLLLLLGADPQTLGYARDYNAIILWGAIPMGIAFGMNNFIRAEGNPARSMVHMLISALLNVLFDFLFITVFHWGVKGAALGTVLAQTVTAILVLFYFTAKKSHVHFAFKNLGLKKDILLRIVTVGSSPFLMQLTASAVQTILNQQLKTTGNETALAAWGIISTIGMFFFMPVFGINGGSQPLVGFNYGAKNFLRVRSTVKWAIAAATAVMTLGFVVMQLFSQPLMALFTGQDAKLLEVGSQAMKVIYLMLPLIGFQVIAAGYFTSVGRPISSMFLTLSRQILFLIPLLLIFPLIWHLDGVFWAIPAADFLSTLVTLVFFLRELGSLGRRHDEQTRLRSEAEAELAPQEPPILGG